jgi:hypothetical protein
VRYVLKEQHDAYLAAKPRRRPGFKRCPEKLEGMTMTRTIIIAVLAATVVIGCTTGERITGLREGMTPAQVTDVMGAPTGQHGPGM